MPDPLQALPNELRSMCIEFAIIGLPAGPLHFLRVSRHWERFLVNSPSLWTHISIQNGEDEMARISIFLHLSKQCQLHVDVMTVLPTVDGLSLVAEHISRVRTISILPGAPHTVTALHAKQWKRAAAYVLETLSSGKQLSDVESPGSLRVAFCDESQWYYHVIFLHFTVAARVASIDEPSRMWEDYLTQIISTPEGQDSKDRQDFISLIAEFRFNAQFHDIIRIAIPSLSKLLDGEDEKALRPKIVDLIGDLANHVELHEAIARTIPLLIKRLEDQKLDPEVVTDMFLIPDHYVRRKAAKALANLANRGAFHEAISSAIPLLIEWLGNRRDDENEDVRRSVVKAISNLANLDEFHRAIRLTIPSLIGRLEDEDITLAIVEATGELANHAMLHEAIASKIPVLISCIESKDKYVESATVELIGKLANRVEFHEAITNTILVHIRWFEYWSKFERLTTIAPIDKLTSHEVIRELIASLIPSLMRRHEDLDGMMRSVDPGLIRDMASFAEFHEPIVRAIPLLIKQLEDEDWRVQTATAELINGLAKHVDFRDAIISSIPSIIKLLENREGGVRQEAGRLIDKLGDHTEFREAIVESMHPPSG